MGKKRPSPLLGEKNTQKRLGRKKGRTRPIGYLEMKKGMVPRTIMAIGFGQKKKPEKQRKKKKRKLLGKERR